MNSPKPLAPCIMNITYSLGISLAVQTLGIVLWLVLLLYALPGLRIELGTFGR